MPLSQLWDGWVHYMTPDEDFTVPGSLVADLSEGTRGEQFESCEPVVFYTPKPAVYPDGPPAGAEEESAWAGLTMALGSLAEIVGGKRKSYQENTYGPDNKVSNRKYSFKFEAGETGFKGGRL